MRPFPRVRGKGGMGARFAKSKSSSLRSLPLTCPPSILSPQAGRGVQPISFFSFSPRAGRNSLFPSPRKRGGIPFFLLPASGEKVPKADEGPLFAKSNSNSLRSLPLTCPRIKYGAGSSGILSPQAGRGVKRQNLP